MMVERRPRAVFSQEEHTGRYRVSTADSNWWKTKAKRRIEPLLAGFIFIIGKSHQIYMAVFTS